jgi:glycerate kinase
VDNPLTGPAGAAAVYGPQKGCDPTQVALLDAALERWADVVAAETGADHRHLAGAGAAGGVGFAAVGLLGATLRPGIDLVLDLVGFDQALVGCDLVITGEGSLDAQSLHGKAPVGVADRARAVGVPVVAVAGRSMLSPADLAGVGIIDSLALLDLEPDVATCLASPLPLLEMVGAEIARRHLS